MKQTMTVHVGTFILVGLCVFVLLLPQTHAHEGVVHDSEAEAVAHEQKTETTDIVKLQEIVTLLNQLILLINALHIQQGYTPVSTTPSQGDAHDEMEIHHDEHSLESESDDTEEHADEDHLVIEIEPHNNQTHAHVRYVDKPEVMFFVESGIDDEDGIVADIHERTGLEEEEIRDALKYMQ